ncbi:MAG: type II toxin-antitoxin system VapC family toxin [Candidatus Marsarchaeota archaeon]|nr:type II toxin-antitoxin system VapC family toxin [Candidatus Marsarchaeota archaeon]
MQVIDSSALVKFFSREDGWEAVSQYVKEALTLHFALSELGNSLLKKIHSNNADVGKAEEVLKRYSKSAVLLNDEEYVESAFHIARANGLAMYDSMFIAACKEEGMELVTCDAGQASVARQLGIGVMEF